MPFPFLLWGAIAAGTAAVGWIGKMTWGYFDEKAEAERQEQEKKEAEERKRTFKDYERVIWLQGIAKAGKDTILHIIKGDGFKEHYPTTHGVGENYEAQIANAKWKLINTGGSSANNAPKEQWRNERLKTLPQEAKKKVLWLYVFDMQNYDKDHIKSRIEASRSTAKDCSISTFIAVGTHLDRLQAAGLDSKIEQIQSELDELGIHYFPYDLSKNPRAEIIQMIQSV